VSNTHCVVFWFVFLRLVCHMLPVSLYCLFLIAPSVFSNYYSTFLFRKWKLIISTFVRFILSQLFLNFISRFASFPLKNLTCILTGYAPLPCILYYRKGSIFTHIDVLDLVEFLLQKNKNKNMNVLHFFHTFMCNCLSFCPFSFVHCIVLRFPSSDWPLGISSTYKCLINIPCPVYNCNYVMTYITDCKHIDISKTKR